MMFNWNIHGNYLGVHEQQNINQGNAYMNYNNMALKLRHAFFL
jgi:hypothetical protein